MSTIFNIRNMELPRLSRTSIIIGSILVVVALAAGIFGWQLYRKLTTNTVVAYFPSALALYTGDRVTMMGAQIGKIEAVEPAGDKIKVTFRYANKYKVPENATASIVNPSLVASRVIQLAPSYAGGPVMRDGAVIPVERTQVPVEWDDLRNSVSRLVEGLGPTSDQPRGPFGDIIEAAANGLAGKGKQINTTLKSLSEAVTAVNEGSGDFFAVVRRLATFVSALYQQDRQFVALNHNLADVTGKFTNTDRELSDALRDLNVVLSTTRRVIDDNGKVLVRDINNLQEVSTALVQPEVRDALETTLHIVPNALANLINDLNPVMGNALLAIPAIPSFANPMQFLCSAIQAGSRLGYQESAELCAQYLAPILDAIKFNSLPFGLNLANTAYTLPKLLSYSEDRLRPPPGYKDTTVPGIWSRDTLFSHGNHEPGWTVAPGMQGVDVQPFTANLLTPESLAELMGGPDAVPPPAPAAFGVPPGGNLPGSPNDYDDGNPLAPQPAPTAPPAPAVIPGDPLVATAPAAPGPALAQQPPLSAESGN